MKILIVDDNPNHAELAAHRLKKEGWQVVTTNKTEPDESYQGFDFFLIDYSMPTCSGLDLLKKIRTREIRTPIIFLTGHGNEFIASEAIKQGAYDYVVKDTQLLYLDRLPSVIREAKSKHELVETNRFLIQELRRANEKLRTISFTDEMTGVYNYRFLRKQLETEVLRADRYAKNMSICIVDIDFFKKINDEHGHPTGDAVLKELGKILKDSTREVDFAGRYAGDEFLIIFPDTSLRDAQTLCERIRSNVESHNFISQGNRLKVTLCLGVANFSKGVRDTVDSMIEAADRCLYEAKKRGRNRVVSIEDLQTPILELVKSDHTNA